MSRRVHPLVAVVGPTASGKTDLAITLAKRYSGEVICADSRTIYRGMDIGTAKPTMIERTGIVHHGLDILSPNEAYSAAEFKNFAEKTTTEVCERGNLPIITGGTGLYLWAFLYNYSFPAGTRNHFRTELEQKSLSWLTADLKQKDPEAYAEVDLKNKRRVIRAIETAGQPKNRSTNLRNGCILVGLCPEFELLEKNIQKRTEKMVKQGLVNEVKKLVEQYGSNTESLQSVGYKEIIEYLNGSYSLEEAKRLISLHTRQLAKRQMTWFKRNKDIQWVETAEQAEQIIKEKLQMFGTMEI